MFDFISKIKVKSIASVLVSYYRSKKLLKATQIHYPIVLKVIRALLYIKSKGQQVCTSFQFPCLFQLLKATCRPWLRIPSSAFKVNSVASSSNLSLCLEPSFPPTFSSFKGVCAYIGPSQIIYEKSPNLKVLSLTTFAKFLFPCNLTFKVSRIRIGTPLESDYYSYHSIFV